MSEATDLVDRQIAAYRLRDGLIQDVVFLL
jgi:hypothetical protein